MKGNTMKVSIDDDSCVGCGTCVEICPEIFEMDDDLAEVKAHEVPENLQESCREAADACPVEAVIIED
jgi:ferredoxin